MLNKLKEILQKRKQQKEKQKAENARLSKVYPRDYCFYGSYRKKVEENGLVYYYQHSDIFLADKKYKPTKLIRLSGENRTDEYLTPKSIPYDCIDGFIVNYSVIESTGREYLINDFDYNNSFDRKYLYSHSATLSELISECYNFNARVESRTRNEKLNELTIQQLFNK